jgi:hypothetical protein
MNFVKTLLILFRSFLVLYPKLFLQSVLHAIARQGHNQLTSNHFRHIQRRATTSHRGKDKSPQPCSNNPAMTNLGHTNSDSQKDGNAETQSKVSLQKISTNSVKIQIATGGNRPGYTVQSHSVAPSRTYSNHFQPYFAPKTPKGNPQQTTHDSRLQPQFPYSKFPIHYSIFTCPAKRSHSLITA